MGEIDGGLGFPEKSLAEERIKQYLNSIQNEKICTIFLVAIDHFDRLKNSSELNAAADAVQYIGRVLRVLFRDPDIIGQTGDGIFAVGVAGELSYNFIFQKAAAICERIQLEFENGTYREMETVCVGVYTGFVQGVTAKSLYEKAGTALFRARQSGCGSFYITGNPEAVAGMQEEREPKLSNVIRLHTLLRYMDGGVCLLAMGKDISLIYASKGFYTMTGISRSQCVLPCSLDSIGIHPDYLEDYKQNLWEGMNSGQLILHVHRIRGKSLPWIWRQTRVVRIPDPDTGKNLMLEFSTDITELTEKERQLKESNERLRIAFEQTADILWEVDLDKRTYGIYDVQNESLKNMTEMKGFPEALLESGYVHPRSVDAFRDFAGKILRGCDGGEGNFVVRDAVSDCYEWAAFCYHMVYDEEGNPVKAIGIQEKMPDITGMNNTFMFRRPLPEALRQNLLARLQANLTENSVEYLWMDGRDQTARTWGKLCSDILEKGELRLFVQGEGSMFRDRYQRKNLLKAYQDGKYWSSCEFRRISADGSIRWTMDMMNFQYDIQTDSVYLFSCFFDIQQRKDWEQLLPEVFSREKKNGLYDRKTAEELCRLILPSAKGDCAMVCVSLVGIDSLEADEEENGSRDFILLVLSYALGTDCVAGYYEKDKIMVFFPVVDSTYTVKRRMEDALAYVRTVMSGLQFLNRIRFVAGVVLTQAQEADVETMQLQAAYVCNLWKNSAMDYVAFPSEDEDWSWINMRSDLGTMINRESVSQTMMTKEIRETVLDSVTSMLKSSSLSESIHGALRYIGRYYDANRIYILSLSEDSGRLTMLYEWIGKSKYSIRQAMSGIQIEKVPLLRRCRDEGTALIVKSNRKGMANMSGERNLPWHFIAYPMKYDEKITGFFCVENAHAHEDDVSLIAVIMPYFYNEYQRFHLHSEKMENSMADVLYQIPNLRMYKDVVISMTSDVYSSMGVVALDVPGFSAINGKFGFEYGREVLFFIVSALNDIFDHRFVFRTWDAEFVVLFPNMILEVFNGRCTRLCTRIQRRYPHQIRIGYTWSDGIFSAKNLVKEAKSIMQCEEIRDILPDRSGIVRGNWMGQSTGGLDENSYVLYLQPKIDMRDGSLAGAEALARKINHKGEIIPPSQFIETLEENGGIRDLDFFMLESVLRQLSRWKDGEMSAVSISVNISRYTLLNPTVLASVLAFYSHYPEIPISQVELEITETAGNVEKSTLGGIVEGFREYGIGLELDDFGSEYANLSIFSSIKFNAVKLDRSLVNDLPDNEISRMMVENISGICSNFGMRCVAEGVENQSQKEMLLDAGCFYGQGYYFARPMPVWKFEEMYLKSTK